MRIALAVVCGLCAALAGAPAHAARKPLPAQAIVDAERAFQQSVIDHGQREGFLLWLAETGVLLQPRPVSARATLASAPDNGAQLRWVPDLASISGRGDFGWASGPWMLWPKTTTERASATGHYVTVWRREADGSFRVLLDGGSPYPVPEDERPTLLQPTLRLRDAGGGRGRVEDCTARFAALWRKDGRRDALKEYAAKDIRLVQAGARPLDGRKAARREDQLTRAPLEAARITRTLRSERGDSVVSYGEYDLAATAELPRRRYTFVQAWDVDDECELALELITPLSSAQ